VRKEMAVYFLSYNLIRANMARSAVMNHKMPREFSFMTAVQLFTKINAQVASYTGKKLMNIINSVLNAMTSIGIGKQKRKNQPRAIKRRPKAYPRLMIPRNEACNAINQGSFS